MQSANLQQHNSSSDANGSGSSSIVSMSGSSSSRRRWVGHSPSHRPVLPLPVQHDNAAAAFSLRHSPNVTMLGPALPVWAPTYDSHPPSRAQMPW
jgi:hypothetical protein